MIRIAVVIVTYRTADLTIDCLRSIEAEHIHKSIRLSAVVVDNSSEDFCAIKRAIDANGWSSWAQVVCAPSNGGFAAGNNFGIRIANVDGFPDFIHLLNPDTVIRSGAIISLAQFLQSNAAAGIAGSSFENLDGSDWPFAFRFPTIMSELEEGLQFGIATRLLRPWVVAQKMGKSPQRVDWVPGASMMIAKRVFEAIGELDEGYFLYFEETDFCFRAKKGGFETWYVPESRVMHIAGQSTKVTERNEPNKRLPDYWFESRQRFFFSAYGLGYAIAADFVAILARLLGAIKSIILGHKNRLTPRFITDLIRHTLLWTTNRSVLKLKPKIGDR